MTRLDFLQLHRSSLPKLIGAGFDNNIAMAGATPVSCRDARKTTGSRTPVKLQSHHYT